MAGDLSPRSFTASSSIIDWRLPGSRRLAYSEVHGLPLKVFASLCDVLKIPPPPPLSSKYTHAHTRAHPPPIPQTLSLAYSGIEIAEFITSEHWLPRLEHLFLGSCDHFGPHKTVPPAVFRPGLRKLNMSHIRGPLPNNMGCMVNLTQLELEDGELATLPDSLGDLRSLEKLIVSNCGLEALPESITRLSGLQELRVANNKLRFCPPLGALRKLRTLWLHENYLASLPEGITDLPLLEWVSIPANCMYTLEWDAVKRLPLLGSSDPMPEKYDPSNERLARELTMRTRSGSRYPGELPTIV